MSVTGETVECDASASKYSYSAIFEYVTNALYPSDVSKEYKRGLQKRAAFFSVEAGHLYYVGGKTKQRPRMVIEKEEDQLKIVKTVHEEDHLGRDKTLAQISDRYYWPELYNQVRSYLICRFGCPVIIKSEQGREFVNKLSDELFMKTNTKHNVTSPYQPQTNGITERFNQTLSRCLAKSMSDISEWDEKIDTVLFAYRVSKNKSTGYSPYFMILEDENVEEFLSTMLQIKDEIKDKANANITKAQSQQKEYFDRRHFVEV
eukprot:Em0002g389a